MSTESDRLSENRHQEPASAEEPQRAGTSGPGWPDQVVSPWSVPPGLIAPHAVAQDAERPDATPADAEPASDDDDLPGVSPPAGWFLRSPASRSADSLQTADAEEGVTGEWFASPAPEPGESPISWYEGMDDPEPDAQLPAPAIEEPVQLAADSPASNGAVNGAKRERRECNEPREQRVSACGPRHFPAVHPGRRAGSQSDPRVARPPRRSGPAAAAPRTRVTESSGRPVPVADLAAPVERVGDPLGPASSRRR